MTNFLSSLALWQKDSVVLIVLNIAILTDIVGMSDVAGIFFLAIFPGILAQRLIAYRAEFVWERIIHTVALSISFVMFGGLIVNTLLPVLNIVRPLEQLPVLVSFNVLLIALIVTNFILKREVKIFLKDISIKDAISRVLPHLPFFILPILAIAGATILNNAGTNVVAGAAVCATAAFFIYAISADYSKRETIIVTGLYCASLTLLLATSMRSSHVLGWDINAELQVFRLTQDAAYWSMSHLQSAYNACLSITLLPVVFSKFVHISDEYVFKFLFQFFFAIMPISVFYFVRNFFCTRIAVLSVAMLIGQAVFSHGMPALIRQEFGLLYFGLTLFILFSTNLENKTRYSLALIYGFSIVVSHYSTTYITVLLLGLMFLLNLGLFFAKKISPSILTGNVSHKIGWWYIVLLMIGTLVWGSVITGTSNNITNFIDHSKSNIAESFTYDTFSRAIAELFTQYPRYESLDSYMSRETANFRKVHSEMSFYGADVTTQWTLVSKNFEQSPGLFGSKIKTIGGQVFQVLKIVLNNLFVVLGMLVLIYEWRIRKFQSSELILFATSGFIAMALILLLPDALSQYNIDRLYFQLLMVWSLASVLAGLAVLSPIPVRARFLTLGVMYCTLMLFYSSLIFTLVGGPAFTSMNNFGAEYDKFYAHDSEISAARWVGENTGSTAIFSNSSGGLWLRSHGNILKERILMTTLPSMVDKDSYVFFTRMSVVSGISTYIFYNEEYAYTTPMDFFNKNKNLIYDSGTSRVYR